MSNEILERGEGGRIVKKVLSSEDAKELNRLSLEGKRRKSAEAIRETADAILRDLAGVGYDEAQADWRKLAEIAAKEGGGAVSALNQLQRQTGNIVKTEKTDSPLENWDPESGDPCPVCGGARVTIVLDNESAIYLAGVLNETNVEMGPIGRVEGRKAGNGRSTGVSA